MESFSCRSMVWKVVILSLLMMTITAVSASLEETDQMQVSTSGGRFLLEDSVAGRRLLNNLDLCGKGPDGCRKQNPKWKDPRCCVIDRVGKVCKDVGDNTDLHCGACNKKCSFGFNCCSGKCVDEKTDRNNCGKCGHKCPYNKPCRRGMCGY